MTHILSFLLFFPIFGAILLASIPNWNTRLIKSLGLSVSLITFVASLFLWILFDNSTAKFQFVEELSWLPGFNMNFYIGVDGISLFFILLTTFLVPVCLLVGWQSVQNYVKEYFIAFLILESFMIAVFCMLDLLLF